MSLEANNDSKIASLKAVQNYQFTKTIGKGQFGSVKIGVHTKTNQKVIFILCSNIWEKNNLSTRLLLRL